MEQAITRIDIPELPAPKSGKVREVFDLGTDLLIVSTDRISAFDHILPQGIPGKGKVLNQISRFWFEFFGKRYKTHFLSADFEDFPRSLKKYGDILEHRSMLVVKTKPIELECVVRGYLAGSAWKEYQETGRCHGVRLPAGMKKGEVLPRPLFTPTTKAAVGHDENISIQEAGKRFGRETVARLKTLSLNLYKRAASYALGRGIIIADTKFEFGWFEKQILLIDEAFTPDSSRFWPMAEYEPGRHLPDLDKQLVRDYLESTGWDKQGPPPDLPPELVSKTAETYRKIYRILTGSEPMF
jgi:phosphoribosylaminoimidazole-succinocarboxamide synthase